MDKKLVFRCDIMHEDSSVSKAYASLSLPATPYELRDAIERAHLDDGGVHELSDATELLEHMEEYIFSPRFDSPEAVARDELVFMLGEGEAELAFPYVNLHSYGQKLMEAHFQKMTMYGMIEREDKQPFQTMRESQRQQVQPATGRMEMMQM